MPHANRSFDCGEDAGLAPEHLTRSHPVADLMSDQNKHGVSFVLCLSGTFGEAGEDAPLAADPASSILESGVAGRRSARTWRDCRENS